VVGSPLQYPNRDRKPTISPKMAFRNETDYLLFNRCSICIASPLRFSRLNFPSSYIRPATSGQLPPGGYLRAAIF
jgi:hypothetical protein